MEIQKRNGKKKDKYNNMCYVHGCHHNRDKKKIPWKEYLKKFGSKKGA